MSRNSTILKKRKAHAFAFKFQSPTLAKQSFAKECDINQIMRKFEKDGVLLHANEYQGQYGDFAQHPEYHEAQNLIADANSMFETIPSQIRAQFGNSPEKFLAFAQNKDNQKALDKMGLGKPKDPTPIQREVVPPKTKKEVSKETPKPTNTEGQDTL